MMMILFDDDGVSVVEYLVISVISIGRLGVKKKTTVVMMLLMTMMIL